MSHPERLDYLDLDKFAEQLYERDHVRRRLILYSIRDEFKAPFKSACLPRHGVTRSTAQ